MRIGHGYDVHRLVAGRKLILGGVEIPHHLGLLGHSDADVVTHALMDALLGAAALGDIGQHFPDTDPAYAQMRQNYARAMGLPVGAISVKATTEEGLGFTGGELGIAAHGVVLLEALPG